MKRKKDCMIYIKFLLTDFNVRKTKSYKKTSPKKTGIT